MHVLFSILIYWTALSIVNCCPYTIVNCGSFNNGHFLYFLFLPLRSKNMLQDTIKYPMVISISICTSKNEKPYSPYLGLKKYLWFRFPTDPIFSADPIIFSTRLTVRPYFLRVVAGCSYSVPKWRLLSH